MNYIRNARSQYAITNTGKTKYLSALIESKRGYRAMHLPNIRLKCICVCRLRIVCYLCERRSGRLMNEVRRISRVYVCECTQGMVYIHYMRLFYYIWLSSMPYGHPLPILLCNAVHSDSMAHLSIALYSQAIRHAVE